MLVIVILRNWQDVCPGWAAVSSSEGSSGEVPQDGMRTPEGKKDVGNKRWVLSASYSCLGMMALSSYFIVSQP